MYPIFSRDGGISLLRRDDRTPNARGAEALGYTPISTQAFLEKLQAQPNALLYWVEDDLALGEILSQLPAETLLIAHTYNRSAHPERLAYEIAASTHLESFATFINEDGLAQTVQPARQWQQMKPTDWFYLPKSRLDAAGQAVDRWRNPAHIPDCLPTYQVLLSHCRKNGQTPWPPGRTPPALGAPQSPAPHYAVCHLPQAQTQRNLPPRPAHLRHQGLKAPRLHKPIRPSDQPHTSYLPMADAPAKNLKLAGMDIPPLCVPPWKKASASSVSRIPVPMGMP
jgi:hypothetical protein